MDFKLEEYFVFQDKDILFFIFIELGKLFASFLTWKSVRFKSINKSCFKGETSKIFKNTNF